MRRVVVDVDVGVDDFLAILMLLYAEKKNEIKIEAIICTMGNADVEDVCKNVVKLLEITRRTDVSNNKHLMRCWYAQKLQKKKLVGFVHFFVMVK